MAFLKVNYIGGWLLFTTREQRLSAEQPTLKTQKKRKRQCTSDVNCYQHCINNKLPNIIMDSITITYRLKYRFKTHNHVRKSVCNRYFNTQKGNEIFIKPNGGSKGIWLDRRTFIVESKIADNLEPIPKYKHFTNDFLTNLK